MSHRRKRQDKKLHSLYIGDVILAAIISPGWKDVFLDLNEGDSLRLDSTFVAGKTDEASFLIRRFQLSYFLERSSFEGRGDPEPMEGALTFKLQALRHPQVRVFVEEFPDEIGIGMD
jgi:hypothetical protein